MTIRLSLIEYETGIHVLIGVQTAQLQSHHPIEGSAGVKSPNRSRDTSPYWKLLQQNNPRKVQQQLWHPLDSSVIFNNNNNSLELPLLQQPIPPQLFLGCSYDFTTSSHSFGTDFCFYT